MTTDLFLLLLSPLIKQLEHFAEVIKGNAAPIVDARSARETLKVILKIEQETMP